jgi:hypothetical protein
VAQTPARGAVISRCADALGDPRSIPDVQWVVGLLGCDLARGQQLLAEIGEYERIERIIRERHQTGGRDFYAQIRAPFELYALARGLDAREIVETGVSSGVSSAHFLLAIQKNGHGQLHSIDLPVTQQKAELGEEESPVSIPPGLDSGWAVPEELRNGWDLWIGPSEALLPEVIEELPQLDIFLHDSLHTPEHLEFELMTVLPKLHPGSVVLADNTEWTGKAFDRFAESIGARVLRRAGSDLVGLRVPESFQPPKPAAARSGRPASVRRRMSFTRSGRRSRGRRRSR